MPNRIIRDGLIDSERYAQISDQAKLFFIHLMLQADDFGCVSLSPTFLRRRCFLDGPTHDRIARLICELVDADLVRTYEVDRKALAFIPRFRQRLQRSTSKHPLPPHELYKDDADALQKFNDLTQKSTVAQPLPNRSPSVGQPPEVKRSEEKRKEVEVEGLVDKLSTSPSKPQVKTILERVQGKTYSEWLTTLGIEIQKDWTAADAKLAVDKMLAGRVINS